MDNNILLAAENLGLSLQSKTILSEVNLSLRESEIVTLIGPNGAGKTSLIRILLGLTAATEGTVFRRADLNIGYVPQRSSINPVLPLRVLDFLQLGARYQQAEIDQVLEEVGVSHILKSAIQNISGGELQRVLLARALLKKPNVLVLDEPAQGVDIIGQQALYKMIASIRDNHGCGILMVSHDLHLVMAATDQVVCINTHVCCTGHPDDISEHPEYLKLFGSALEGMAVYSHHHDHEHELDGAIVCTHHKECGHHHG
ncbi:MAG: ATP-binding cassette domain-containing protein [Gammaproteobacteria bacterium]|nr:ATP-binding cassette domain-containing protein [Gammaproteobacteria bacterium]